LGVHKAIEGDPPRTRLLFVHGHLHSCQLPELPTFTCACTAFSNRKAVKPDMYRNSIELKWVFIRKSYKHIRRKNAFRRHPPYYFSVIFPTNVHVSLLVQKS
jgi:hypothetical protein